jgi:hypothetical protein
MTGEGGVGRDREWREERNRGLTGRVHNPNFVIGLMTIIQSANKFRVRG